MGNDDELVEVDTIIIPLPDGTEMECAIVDEFEMEDKGYLVLSPLEDDTIGEEVFLYRFEEDGSDLVLNYIDDEDELRRAGDFYYSLIEEEE